MSAFCSQKPGKSLKGKYGEALQKYIHIQIYPSIQRQCSKTTNSMSELLMLFTISKTHGQKHWIMSQTIELQSIVHFNIKRLNVMPWMSEVIHILRNTPQIVYSEREKVDINQKNSIYGYHSILHTMGVFVSFIHAKMTCITFPYIGQSAPIKLPSQKQGDIFCR